MRRRCGIFRSARMPGALLLLCTLLGGWAGRAVGQVAPPFPTQLPGQSRAVEPSEPGWIGDFTVLAANGVLGGATAGLLQMIRGGSFTDGFTRGFLGGGVVYGGKRLAVARFDGAGLLGRQLASTGASISRNAAAGRGTFEEIILPLGPVRVYLEPARLRETRVKLDLNSAALVAYAALRDDLDFDLGASLSSGAPVFTATDRLFGSPTDTLRASGQVMEGVIFLSELSWRSAEEAAEVFAHERVHVLQRDQLFATLGEPASAWVAAQHPLLAGLYRHVDLHPTGAIFGLLRLPFPVYEDRPWEMEARWLGER